ncbi:SusC/RagA family TonB-linked outer membrane protein [Flavivirga eckloniae]|uniref:SusC/RagA family TonB-linked outer membrane protein n=1 Tax=Flavivirga eckloniae TaxID=1803846 RepID=A0A2K9PU72_9FLAO|nr:SusC/RagA family TonB-linked outer membrane protein [Flavivirga eckloniae]AUP80616.1 hypothetical protein C1H87_18620 [Flavivirga eckloniae]
MKKNTIGWVLALDPLKISLKMKLTYFLLFVSLLQSYANSYSQNTKVTLDMREVTLRSVLNEIEHKTDYKFLYEKGIFQTDKIVSISVKRKKLSSILNRLLEPFDVSVEYLDKQIIIKRKPDPVEVEKAVIKESLQQQIKGQVKDGFGLPLPGVSILIKDTTTGTSTDFDGNYEIRANPGDVLVFSFLGYTTQEVVVAQSLVIDVQLKESVGVLEEVIVTAQGIRKEKKALGYAVSTLEGKQLENKAETDVARSLQGKVAGVQINVNSGSTGNQASIRVRGDLSVTNGNSPLIVVDGAPFNGGLIDINPNDIKDFSVLKGLNASLLYGSDGRNGVILITTKSGSGSPGKEKVSINFSHTVYTNQVANLPEYQNKYGQGSDNRFRGGVVGNWGAAFSELDVVPHPYASNPAFPEFANVEVPYKPIPNNVKSFFNTGIGTVTAINFNSSQEKTSFNLSAGYTDETGIIGNNDLKRFNFNIGGSAQVTDKLNVRATINYSTRKRNSQNGADMFEILLHIPRNIDAFNLPFQDPVTGANVYYRPSENPNWVINNTGRNDDVVRIFGTFRANYNFDDHWNLSYRVSLDNEVQDEFDFANRGGVDDPTGFLELDYDKFQTIDQSLILSTSYQLNKKIGLDGQIGVNSQTINNKSNSASFEDQVVFGFLRPDNFDTQSGDASRSKENFAGVFGQLEFNYDKFLYVTVSGRNDWSSTLEKENQSLFYPGVSVSFLPTSALDFNSNIVNYLKIRGAYATSSGFPGRFRTRNTLVSDPQRFITSEGALRSSRVSRVLANPDLRAELHKEVEVGVESKLFNNRVSLEASVFKRISKDQIVSRPLDPALGFTSTTVNIGRVDSEGLEIDLGIDILKSDSFIWNLTNVFTAYNTEVVELNAPISLDNDRFAIQGQPLGVIQEDYAIRDSEGNLLINPNNGELIVSDDIGFPDKIIGDPTPDWALTTINSLSYKGFTFSAQIEYTHGGDNISETAYDLLRRGVTRDTENREGSFIIPGVLGDPSTGLPFLDANGQTIPNTIQANANRTAFSNYLEANDFRLFDTSLFRIREVALSYTLDGKKNKLPFDNIAFTLSGRNVFFNAPNYPKYTNIDPDVDRGSTTIPTTKRYAFGVSISF